MYLSMRSTSQASSEDRKCCWTELRCSLLAAYKMFHRAPFLTWHRRRDDCQKSVAAAPMIYRRRRGRRRALGTGCDLLRDRRIITATVEAISLQIHVLSCFTVAYRICRWLRSFPVCSLVICYSTCLYQCSHYCVHLQLFKLSVQFTISPKVDAPRHTGPSHAFPQRPRFYFQPFGFYT